ncbi:MAG: hypothetical protein DHS20C06_00090 [Hyphobacterium sp.]|nr:MAG: hypothetical protein DHS20C06_00090 [Hyphobacterium sp.]
MTPDLWFLFASIIFGVLHLGLSSMFSLRQLGASYILSDRSNERLPQGLAGRIARAYRNWLESFAQFAAALFLVHTAGMPSSLAAIGAALFFIGRALYLPAYAFAPAGWRPACWMLAQFGILIILADLFV